MKIAVTGASGLIGSALLTALRADGHEVIQLVRRTPRTAEEHRWDPQHHRQSIRPARRRGRRRQPGRGRRSARRPFTSGYKAAADSTAGWTRRRRSARRWPTRPLPTRTGTRVLLSASAVGFYGDTGSRERDRAGPGRQRLPRPSCASQWEAATAPAEAAGVRVVHLRTGLVLDRVAMLMQVMGPIFRLGLGGRLGDGRQYWPWISLADEIGAIRHLLTADVSGPVNLTGPEPVTNAEFTAELGRQVHRPTVLAVPAIAHEARRSASSAARASSAASVPSRCGSQESGYAFTHTDLAAALRAALAHG